MLQKSKTSTVPGVEPGTVFYVPPVENLRLRAGLKNQMRLFFDTHDFLEVETPVRIAGPAPEEYIDCIEATGKFLRPSPELEMKVMLANGFQKIYQFGPCFRADEHGWKHREEFIMLEYYAVGCDYKQLQKFTTKLITQSLMKIKNSTQLTFHNEVIDLAAEPEVITVNEAFKRYTSMDMFEADRLDMFDELMVCKIEPQLGRGRLTYLTDYPANRASLAQLSPSDNQVAERWELYIAGVELANAYGELTNGAEQLKRFEASRDFRKKRGAAEYGEPEAFNDILKRNALPRCSGCALGFDRLVMIAADADDINEVIL
jgi:lysyl-tRNA synthetase class 2